VASLTDLSRFSKKIMLLLPTCGVTLKVSGTRLVKYKTQARQLKRLAKVAQMESVLRFITQVTHFSQLENMTRLLTLILAMVSTESCLAITERTILTPQISSALEKTLDALTLNKLFNSCVQILYHMRLAKLQSQQMITQ